MLQSKVRREPCLPRLRLSGGGRKLALLQWTTQWSCHELMKSTCLGNVANTIRDFSAFFPLLLSSRNKLYCLLITSPSLGSKRTPNEVGSWQFFRLLKSRAYRCCCCCYCQNSVSLSRCDFPIASVFENLLPSKKILKLSTAAALLPAITHCLCLRLSVSISSPVTMQCWCWCQRSNGNWVVVVRPVVDRGMNGQEKKAKESCWGKRAKRDLQYELGVAYYFPTTRTTTTLLSELSWAKTRTSVWWLWWRDAPPSFFPSSAP